MEKENIKLVIQKIDKEQEIPITDLDIKKYLGEDGDKNTMLYSELEKYNDIFELLPTDRSYKIILIEQQKNNGHWTSICRYGNTICFFDAYGVGIDGELKFINRFMKQILGESKHYLTELLKKVDTEKWDIVYNKKKLQKLDNHIATCGKWVILWTSMMKDLLFNLEDFLKFIKDRKEESGLTGDELVSIWIRN
jgi:hypothetical protein